MNPSTQFHTLQQQGETSTEAALNLFDELEPVDLTFMLGRWQGSLFPTHHPLDELLGAAGWYGKEFISPDQVHPLLMTDANRQLFKLAPHPLLFKLALQLPKATYSAFKPLAPYINPLFKTDHSQARLRMMEYRQKLSATMVYDHLPIHDVFRKVDGSTVLGLMDYKEIEQPLFFVLRRDIETNAASSVAQT